MENKAICQSCGMPLDSEDVKGTEKNGMKSNDYCKFCYDKGAFKHPNMKVGCQAKRPNSKRSSAAHGIPPLCLEG